MVKWSVEQIRHVLCVITFFTFLVSFEQFLFSRTVITRKVMLFWLKFYYFRKNVIFLTNTIVNNFTCLKGTISSRSEQTFNRAWNRSPSLR